MYAIKRVKIDLGDYSGGKKRSTQLEKAISSVGGSNMKGGLMTHSSLPKNKKYMLDIDL